MRTLLLPLAIAASCDAEDLDGDGLSGSADCNDRDPAQGRKVALHVDSDGDGFGGTIEVRGCPGNSWLVSRDGDCDDLDPFVFPGSLEIGCDGRDNDCDDATADGPAVTVGATWSSVQAAIDAAGYNEVVELCASTIREALVVRGPPVHLRPVDPEAVAVLDATGLGASALRVTTDLVLERVTVRGGVGTASDGGGTVGGGVLVEDCADVELDDVTIEANIADRGAGLAVVGCGTATLRATTVRDNRAVADGGGVLADGPVAVTAEASTVSGNVAAHGGGLWVGAEAVATLGPLVAVDGNVADRGGGAWLGGGVLDAKGATLTGNQATEGGGVFGAGTVLDATLAADTADRGGGLFAEGALTLVDGVLEDCAATVDDGGGAHVPLGAALVLDDVTIVGGTAPGAGGGVYAEGALTLVDVHVEDTAAAWGGGLACVACEATGDQVEVRRSDAVTAGGALAVGCGGSVALVASTLAEGAAPDGALAWIGGATLSLELAIVTDGLPATGGGWLTLAPDCATDAVLAATDTAISAVPDALSLAGTLRAPPGSTFVCVAGADGVEACVPP